jgi:hypothetical protein
MLSADALLPPAPDAALVRELFHCLDPQHMLTLFAALFGECRIVFSAASNFRLKAVINTLLRLMYPFQWQHMYVAHTCLHSHIAPALPCPIQIHSPFCCFCCFSAFVCFLV